MAASLRIKNVPRSGFSVINPQLGTGTKIDRKKAENGDGPETDFKDVQRVETTNPER
jgi:hypothetical protein